MNKKLSIQIHPNEDLNEQFLYINYYRLNKGIKDKLKIFPDQNENK
jgi:mannose-6-phosphate isomerase class I